METTDTTPEALLQEQARITDRIEEAAVNEDVLEFDRLIMRERALPRLIRDARTAPMRVELARLDRQLEDLVARMEEIRTGPAPEPPVALADNATTRERARQSAMNMVAHRQSDLGRRRKELLNRIRRVEGEVDR